MRWIASLRDLSDPRKLLGAFNKPFAPDPTYDEVGGHRRLNYTNYLDEVPLAEGSPIEVSYSVTDPAGYAAKLRGKLLSRGELTLKLDTHRLCINKVWMERHFGGPFDMSILTDGGGAAWTWDIGVWRRRHVYADAYFGPRDDLCTERISFTQTDRPVSSISGR